MLDLFRPKLPEGLPQLAEKVLQAVWWDGFRTGFVLAAIAVLVVFGVAGRRR
jgi:hypothetical protein